MKNASSNILRINKNGVIYFGLLLLQSTHPVSHTDSASPPCPMADGEKKAPWQTACAVRFSIRLSDFHSPTDVLHHFAWLSFRISIKSFPFLLKHTLARLRILWGSGRRAYATGCAPVPSVLHCAPVCSMQKMVQQSQPQPRALASIHSLALHSIHVQLSICNIADFSASSTNII